MHEAEANKNASNFVKVSPIRYVIVAPTARPNVTQNCSTLKEFKEDLGVTGDKKTDADKKDIQQREDDKIGLKRDENDAKRQEQSKK